MGHYHDSTFGYGLLLLDEDNDPDEDGYIFKNGIPKGITEEFVGDMVIGEDNGTFYKVRDVVITVNMISEKYHNEYVTEYDFEISDIDTGLSEWLENFQKEDKLVGRIGVFQIGSFG